MTLIGLGVGWLIGQWLTYQWNLRQKRRGSDRSDLATAQAAQRTNATMNDLQQRLCQLLQQTSEQMRAMRLPAETALKMERLVSQVEQQCTVAVVGRVKAGKSTFINALLGGDELAKVGEQETTATINIFRYGPTREYRCHWRNGSSEQVDEGFLNSLQTNDPETLRKADGIDHLEIRLPNPYLEQVVLVDTPGLGSVVDKHQDEAAEFLQLKRQLRQRHERETQEYNDKKADAIIYVTDAVARASDQDVLEDFGQISGGRSRALNAIGVMAKIDLYPDLLRRRHELAGKIARQLQEQLNTVVPVSGGLEFALQRMRRSGMLKRLAAALSRVPPATLQKMLDSEELFLEMPCPLSTEERESLLPDGRQVPWTVFTTIVRKVAELGADIERAEQELVELAGFQPLREVLDRHFLRRAVLLHCFKKVNQAAEILSSIRFRELPKLRQRDRDEQAQRDRFLGFVRNAGGDPAVARELEEFVSRVCGAARRSERVKSELRRWSLEFDRLRHNLEEDNADFEILQLLEQHAAMFTAEEHDELRPLLGLYGSENEKRLRIQPTRQEVGKRQQHWHQLIFQERNPIRSQVADRAVARYGLILAEIGPTE